MVFTTQCPQCGKILWFASNLTGRETICPACGAVMRLMPPAVPAPGEPLEVTPPAPPPPSLAAEGESNFEQTQQPPDDQVPAAVEESFLTHQAAAAVGEVHVEVDESDLVQWTMQSESPPPPAVAPPQWTPPPLLGLGQMPQAPRQEMQSYPTRTFSLPMPPTFASPVAEHEERVSRRRQVILWTSGAAAVTVLIFGVLALLHGTKPPTTWEQAHRDEVLAMKQEAEQLALDGKNRQAYDKYQELEKFVAGQTIDDPYLHSELDKSWQRRDALYDQLIGARIAPAATSPSAVAKPPAPPVALAPPRPAPIVIVTKPSTIVAQTAPSPPPPRRRPDVRPDIPPPTGITDARIGSAITRGIDFLLARFSGPRLAVNYEHFDGLDTLAVYALMQAELATGDKRLDIHGKFMDQAIGAVKKFPMTADYVTYARSLRATALALNDRPQDHAVIREDVNWLLHAQDQGAYTYNSDFAHGSSFSFWDNSNSQYGLLGVWSGAEVGIQIPGDFWRDVRAHWTKYQLPDGEWTYRPGDGNPSRSMTLAGIASLFVAQDYLDAVDYGEQVGRPPFSPALDRAMKWLEAGDNSVFGVPPAGDYYGYYALYGLERTGLASGFKYYGAHDWYRERAADLVAAQASDGSWGGQGDSPDAVIDTSFALLFLARGRHPVLMNKLRFEGDWANRPRDVANLARFASEELERPLNWQVVPLDHDWKDWTDSPILYMASDKEPVLMQDDREKIKAYIENGDMLLTQADGNHPEFSHYIEGLGKQLFPQYPWIDLPADSAVLSVSYRIKDAPKIRVITNGSRILMMHWPTDLSHYWQLREDRIGRSAFELGVNLALYAAGKSELKNRVDTDDIAMPAGEALASIQLGRLSYDGNWDPEPQAWPRARRWFRQQTSLDISLQTVPIVDLAALHPPIAHLTGTAKLNLNSKQLAAVKSYVTSGGTLLIEPCGLPGEFLKSAKEDLLAMAFPSMELEPIGDSSPLLTASGNGMSDVTQPKVREFVRAYSDTLATRPMMLKAGAGRVIVLPLDLTSGLLGTDAWGIAGYQPEYALELMKNIVLWAWDGGRE